MVFSLFRGDFRLIFFHCIWGPRRRESMVFQLENHTFSRCSFLASWSCRGPFQAPLGSSWVHLGPKWSLQGSPKLVKSGLGRGPKIDPKIYHFLDQFWAYFGVPKLVFFSYFFGSVGCLVPRWPKMAPRRPKMAQDGPKKAQDAKMYLASFGLLSSGGDTVWACRCFA